MRTGTGNSVGERMTKRVCNEIIRCGLGGKLVARYVPTLRAVRVGIPTKAGAIDCGIDYPADREHVSTILDHLHRHAMHQQMRMREAFRGRPSVAKAA